MKNAKTTQKSEVILAINELAREKGLSREMLFSAIEEATRTAYRRNLPKGTVEPQNIVTSIDRETGEIHVYTRLIAAEEVENPASQITLEEARAIRPGTEIGDIVEKDVTPSGFLRVAALAAKQVIVQRIREAERGQVFDKYVDKTEEILTGVVKRVNEHSVILDLDHTEGILNEEDMMPGEVLREGDHIKVYILHVSRDTVTPHTPQVRVSRRHQNLVKRLFEMEVPEIVTGQVVIKAIAREPGVRTKMAVYSNDPMIDPVGACVGQRGGRVERVVAELKGEKVDIIKWSEDPVEFVANALNPAHVITVFTSTENERECRVMVPDNQLSLAIGKDGLNSSLAHRLTGWRIDIKSQSQAVDMEDMIDDTLPMSTTGSMRMEYDDSLSSLEDDSI
ncbi:MAG: transcription termination/antitermination protein NusA [Clostridia bacterium]|nr:transcription termination/antitermination protein NusA [Clostridia bacterium]